MPADTIKKRWQGRKPSASPSPFQVLALSGGGYRGLFSAMILEEMESRARKPLRDCFDLIAGTSIGGILACGIAAGVPASAMREEFERQGKGIFERRIRLPGGLSFRVPRFGVLGAKYSRAGLEAAVAGTLGKASGTRIADVAKPLVVTAVSATNGSAVLFDSRSNGGMKDVTLREVALSTSAAPTYFPEFNIGGNSLVDGGIVANAPDAVAMMKSMSVFGQRPEEVRMLSIGTAGGVMGEVFRDGRSAGALRWMVARNLFGLTVGAQQELSLGLVRDLLGERYLRIDVTPDNARAKVIALDKADGTATATLRELSKQAMEDADRQRGGDLAAFLRHSAS
ncbi:CBASS cGAMP-activated phospholipase [Pararhizobium sp. BT-229]|uniref:CBASS cGAMP-activated phospholipase n=1 Tax=Pararhizobium sp. BT-229 TaxID=2986923 RepID=UPI0021F7B164|nr:CBASS cGAMP-activated phospholipase [Pararhizobium sp. BT-229]MCV9964302.1 CBASS cGAMP-activated phospholipase [Pararhizobium sp. BT-229]